MARNKSSARKAVLAKALRQNRRLPIFVMARTNRRITRNPKARSWRFRRLKLKVK